MLLVALTAVEPTDQSLETLKQKGKNKSNQKKKKKERETQEGKERRYVQYWIGLDLVLKQDTRS